ncbi:hypothetical protein AB1Y20_006469 [Prymnesium parvum]|uniref:Uncharacterized protein n=1 Tax=Prymnesium parvum TaxID=97485 RepID=A0AB34IY74_PRYPA
MGCAQSPRCAAWRQVAQAHPLQLLGEDSIFSRCRTNRSELCYGEPTLLGLRMLWTQWPRACALVPSSVLYDVGAGFGRLSAFLRVHSNASRVVGLEVDACRHAYARGVRETLWRHLRAAPPLDFRLGDVRALGFAEATHVLVASQCWREELLLDVLRKALASSRLECLTLISRKLPRGWTARVRALAAAFGDAVAVNFIPTTYVGASAVYFKRGLRCSAAPRLASARQRCWSPREVEAETERQAASFLGGREALLGSEG